MHVLMQIHLVARQPPRRGKEGALAGAYNAAKGTRSNQERNPG